MKNPAIFLLPMIIIVLFAFVGGRLMASGAISPTTMIIIAVGAFLLMMLVRPKKQAPSGNADTTLALLGDFSKDAFSQDEHLNTQFQSALSDYVNSMPKAAQKKLENLQPQCKTDADTYAVSLVLGLVKSSTGDYAGAIKLFNQAVILNPTADLADLIGSTQQRIGQLEAALDSYAFALDLDPDNINIRGKLATAYVADGDFISAIDHAQMVLDRDENHASALATIAICHGCLDHADLYSGYTARAVENGYKEEKITATVDALKKKYKKTIESLK